MDYQILMTTAAATIRRVTTPDGRLHGDVGAAVHGANGRIYTGVCIDTPSWGVCAERSALTAMVTDGEYHFTSVVAAWQDPDSGAIVILPPCGHCRQFMVDLGRPNLEATVILDTDRHLRLRDLLPHHEWPRPLRPSAAPADPDRPG